MKFICPFCQFSVLPVSCTVPIKDIYFLVSRHYSFLDIKFIVLCFKTDIVFILYIDVLRNRYIGAG